MLRFAQAAAAMARTAERRCGELQFNLWGKYDSGNLAFSMVTCI